MQTQVQCARNADEPRYTTVDGRIVKRICHHEKEYHNDTAFARLTLKVNFDSVT